jgi:ABC-type phosphate transport system substrate-binding protein
MPYRFSVSKKAVLLGLAVAGIAAIVVMLAMQPRPDGGETAVANTTVIAEAAPVIDVISAPSAFPFVERWAAQYGARGAGEVNVDYQDEIEDLGNSDLAIVGNVTAKNSTFIPVSPQAVAVVYNIPSFPDVPSGMKFNATVLSAVLNGNISRWNNVSISGLNPDLNLPSENIIVIHESSNSSSLALLENYLDSKISWSNDSITVSDSNELASMVRKTPYSIGYVDYSYAIQTKMTFAAIANSDNMYVVPSMESISEAIETGGQVQNIPFINGSRLGNSSYPLVGLYYGVLSDDAENATADFVSWLIDESGGQQTLAEVQYPPVYDNRDLAAYAANKTRNLAN